MSETSVLPQPGLAHGGSRARVLVVEDDDRMRRVLQLLMERHWAVDLAADAAEAKDRIRENVPDLVLADLLLPGMDGFALIQGLKAEARTRAVPVIAISGLAEEGDRLKALQAGASDYLLKPFSEKELLLRVSMHLENAFLRRETARRETEAHLRAVLDAALDAVISTTSEGLVTYWNPQAEATFGFSRDEAMGRSAIDLIVPPADREAHRERIQRYLATGEEDVFNRRLETVGARKDGSRFPMELTVTAAHDWGAVTFSAFARDITDRKKADEDRTRLLEEARQANRMKDEFLALLSHELRTPLSAIVGWAHMLRSGSLDEATTARAIETIERNAKLQNQLIEDILDVSRIVAGKFHVDMRIVDLVRVVEAARDTVAPAAAARGVDLEVGVLSTTAVTNGDPDRLQQAVWNLLTNAIKFTPKGGKVRVELGREPTGFRITVRDTGAGIAPDFLPHIFERFRQDGTSGARRQGGLGLGLSIVRHIVELHGGTVSVHSAGAGQGASFTIVLPVAAGEAERVPPLRRATDTLDSSPRLDRLKVLVVDDEPDARNLIAAVLQGRGARVFMAGSADEALAVLQREGPDVLLSDISLPDTDGYDLVRRVRSLPDPHGRVPAAALTAFSRIEDRVKALSAGYQLHVGKPVDPGELVMVVATLGGATN